MDTMGAFFSGTDDADEKETRVFGVFGKLNTGACEYKFRVSVGGQHVPIELEEIFTDSFIESSILTPFPEEWLTKVVERTAVTAPMTTYAVTNPTTAGFKPNSYTTPKGVGRSSSMMRDPKLKRFFEDGDDMADANSAWDLAYSYDRYSDPFNYSSSLYSREELLAAEDEGLITEYGWVDINMFNPNDLRDLIIDLFSDHMDEVINVLYSSNFVADFKKENEAYIESEKLYAESMQDPEEPAEVEGVEITEEMV